MIISVLAGYGVNNINPGIFGLLNTTSLTEYRGLNYLLGGDAEAVTIANFMKHYNPQICGPSIGYHELRRMQKGKLNLCMLLLNLSNNAIPHIHNFILDLPQVDNLNAAKSSAKAVDLEFELEYLVQSMIIHRIYYITCRLQFIQKHSKRLQKRAIYHQTIGK